MGTSGAFGGSTTGAWKNLQGCLDQIGADGLADLADLVPQLPGLTKPADQAPASSAGELIAALLAAIQSDDPAIKPGRAPRPTASDSGLFVGALTGNTRLRGTVNPPPTTGRRQIAASSGKAGRAIGAGHALLSGNSAALAAYGLSLAELSGKGRVSQILAILEAVEAGSSGPDDVALRAAVVRELNRMCDVASQDGAPPPPEQSVRAVMCEYVLELAAIEIEAWAQKIGAPTEKVIECEVGVDAYIRVAVELLDVSGARLLTPDQFAHAAREILRATLAILPKGGTP